ncbi:MAG: hypothetical protein Q9190_000998 [Brigantiaea leucoxantha]
MSSPPKSTLIVGSGIFGTSTALHLLNADPSATVTLVDRTPFPCPYAASHDVNKIVRADYGDIFYVALALEAQDSWRQNPLYKPYYHETGMMVIDKVGLGPKIIQNYKDLGVDFAAEMVSPEEARSRFNGMYQDADWTDVKEVFWNPRSGWAEATTALGKTIEAIVERGVTYVEATVSNLLFNENGDCLGVNTEDGKRIEADQVILCTGAQTAKLLADSAPHRKEIQIDGRMVAAGVVEAFVRLSPEQKKRFDSVPVFVHEMGNVLGETMPPTPDNLLKFCRDFSFTHKTHHAASGQTISVPPLSPSQSTWSQDVPQGLKDEIREVMTRMYGREVEGFKFESYRMCWDAVTSDQNWLISAHPHSRNLYIATAGSFHGWKFLPIIGGYIVKMLRGELSEEQRRRWGWDNRNDGGGAHERLLPKRDLHDIKGYE